jgi:hypothetical protein
VGKLMQEFEDLLTGGGSKQIAVEGVELEEVSVTRQGNRLEVKRFSIKRVNAPPGHGDVVREAFEDAAVNVARKRGVKTVTIDVSRVTNPGWREHLESIGYKKTVTSSPEGFGVTWVKTITL